MIKVLLVDDHKVLLDGLSFIVESDKELEEVGVCLNGKEAINFLDKNTVDVVVLDLNMPEMNGFETAKKIEQQYPEIKILILTTFHDIETVIKATKTNISGYILKNKAMDDLIFAIKKVYNGQKYFDHEITEVLIDNLNHSLSTLEIKKTILTKREKEILILIAKGNTTLQISKMLSISPSTVETHRRNLIEKIGVKGGSKGLVRYAFENNYI